MKRTVTHAQMHMAIRRIVAGTRYPSFQVWTCSIEHHQNRVLVDYVARIPGLTPRSQFRSSDPDQLLALVREAMRREVPIAEEIPPVLAAIGGVSHLRRVK